jgi:hypothetical protein
MTPPLPAPKPAFSEEVDEFVEFTDRAGGRKPAFSEEVDEFVEFTDVATDPQSAPSPPATH